MMTEYDDKGKFFTQVVTKKPLQVIIRTPHQRIEGEYHIRPSDRLKDDLNQDELFIALTNARIFNAEDQPPVLCNFMLINRNHIIWIIPEPEILPDD
jgi:hypothetical protein